MTKKATLAIVVLIDRPNPPAPTCPLYPGWHGRLRHALS